MEKIVKKAPLISISKRSNTPFWVGILVRLAAIVIALFICAIFFVAITKERNTNIMMFFSEMWRGVFGSKNKIWRFLKDAAILLIISIAITPAFKMKFWNIGAEGQVLIGALVTAGCMYKLNGVVQEEMLIVLMLALSIVASIIWTVIPAIFKAIWNTNETLFTLMMNYIAMNLVSYFISKWIISGSGVMPRLSYGALPALGTLQYGYLILIVAVITILITIYLKYSKHGYEIGVVGESLNTAKYIGINVKKVIIRTLVLSGAVAGIAGFLLVSGDAYSVSTSLVGGRGFTAVLISWISHFSSIGMVFISTLVSFLTKGTEQVATTCNLGEAFADVVISIMFFAIIACEFFLNYKIKFRALQKKETKIELVTTDDTTNKIDTVASQEEVQ